MAKFWMTEKNGTTPADDFDLDIDNDYYGAIDSEKNSFSTGNLYGDEFSSISSDVHVVMPDDEEEEETLYKVLYAPEDCECRADVVESLMNGRVVVINTADLDRENMLRMFDYVMGALQALGGDMKRYGKKIVALFPAGVDIDTPLEDIEDEPYDDNEEELDGNN